MYAKPNKDGNRHLIYRPSTDQIVVTKDYQTVPVSEDLIDTTGKYTSISVKHSETTNTSTFLQGLFAMYLHKTVIISLDVPCHLYNGISTVVHLLMSLLISLWNGILQSSLLTPLPSIIISLKNGVIQSSLLVSLQSTFVLVSPLTSLWKIFL